MAKFRKIETEKGNKIKTRSMFHKTEKTIPDKKKRYNRKKKYKDNYDEFE